MQYIDRNLSEQFLGLSAYPESMYKKVTLLKYFRNYMSEHLLKVMNYTMLCVVYKYMHIYSSMAGHLLYTYHLEFLFVLFPCMYQAGGTVGEREIDEGVRLPYLRTWTRTKSAIILHLSNGTLQVTPIHMYCMCTFYACVYSF